MYIFLSNILLTSCFLSSFYFNLLRFPSHVFNSCPYCDVRSTHAGYKYIQTHYNHKSSSEKKFIKGQMVKSRQEPCHILQIAEIIAGIKNVDVNTVADICYNNSSRVFGWKE
jgi:Tat protein secretion system quality control protein TatD with DNase activity